MSVKFRVFLPVLCVLALISSLSVATETTQASALDTAFQSGTLSFGEIECLTDPESNILRFPAGWEDADLLFADDSIQPGYSQDGKWITFSYDEPYCFPPHYYSPDGSTTLFFGDERYSGYVIQGDVISMLRFDSERSVDDTYGAFAKFSTMIPNRWVGLEGLAWSPDGRYAVLTNSTYLFRTYKFIYGLYVIDTQTSEMLCLDTYSTNAMKDGASVLQACFDNTGRYLYYMLLGQASADDEDRVSLMRYDMETGEKAKLYGESLLDATFPKLQTDAQGRLWRLRNYIASSDEYSGLNLYQADGEVWTTTTYSLSQPAKAIRPFYMEIAGDTGVMLAYIDSLNQSDQYTLPMRFFPEETPEHFDEVLLISGFDATRAEALCLSDEGSMDTLAAFDSEGGLKCVNIKLSPDGRYALLLMKGGAREYGYMMMDTQTLALCRVDAPDQATTIYAMLNGLSSNPYPPGFNWFSGNTFVISTESGPALFALDYE